MSSKIRSWRRDISLFLTSQLVSLLGSSLVQYAITWHITLTTKSGSMMTLSIICGFLPLFILSPFAGVWADRFDRRKLAALADFFIALVTLGAALAYLAGYDQLWILFLVQAFRAAGQAFHQPAVGALLPQIVPEDKLMRVNGLNSSLQSALMLISPAVAGVLLSVTSIKLIFFIDIITAAIAISILLLALRIESHKKARSKQSTSYFRDLIDGLRYIKNHPYLVSLFSYFTALYFLISPAAFLTPLQTTRVFGADIWRLTAIELVFSVGMTAGGALIAVWGGFRNRVRTIAASTLLMAFCSIALGLAPWFWLYLTVMTVFGIALPFLNTPGTVMLQEHVDGDYLGRTFSILSMLSSSVMPLSMLIFGPLADQIDIDILLIVSGAGMVAIGFSGLFIRRLLAAGESNKKT